MATTEVKVKQEVLESEENRGTLSAEEAAKQLAAAQTAAALAGAMPVGLTAEQMQALAASAALGQLGSLQYLNGMLTAANTAAIGSTQGGVTAASTAATPSPLLVVPQIPAQYMAYLPQYAAAAQASTTTQAAQPQATAAVTPTAPASYDAGVLDLSKGPSSKTPSPNTADSANDTEEAAKQLAQQLANIPYEARERTKAEKQDDSQEMMIEGKKGRQTGKKTSKAS